VTILYAVPAVYSALAAECAPDAFASVRVAVSAGETLRPSVRERAAALLGTAPLNQLGSTEMGHGFCSNTITEHQPDTIGRALPGFELAVRDPDGRSLPDGEQGELWVRGPTLLTGFLNASQDTAEQLVDGWWNTRDLVVRRPDGVVVHQGRADDLEMVGGITIAPWETERALERHAGVTTAVVTTVLDERAVSKLWAYVLPAPGVAGTDALATELLAAARLSLAPYKVPRGITFVDDLPRTATGKTRRFLVRQGDW
jgi:fatty-acyl-CoA synthase/fatty acid CoA ligase FadD22